MRVHCALPVVYFHSADAPESPALLPARRRRRAAAGGGRRGVGELQTGHSERDDRAQTPALCVVCSVLQRHRPLLGKIIPAPGTSPKVPSADESVGFEPAARETAPQRSPGEG